MNKNAPATSAKGVEEPRQVLLSTRDLCKRFPDGNVTALDNVNLAIHRGEYVAIMGHSGSGKSTLLSMLGGLDKPTSGEVLFEGKPLAEIGSLDQYRSEKLGFVFQSFHLLPTLTAVENIITPMFESKRPAAQRVPYAKELLKLVGLEHRANHLPNKLSVGERQRVAIARSLANEPSLLLADEPTGNLDSKTEREILELFDDLHQQHGVTLILITHSDVVAEAAHRVIHMLDGRIQSDAS